MTEETEVKCRCGADIDCSSASYKNCMNELGEDYFEIEYECEICKREYKASGYSHIESDEELREELLGEIEYSIKNWDNNGNYIHR